MRTLGPLRGWVLYLRERLGDRGTVTVRCGGAELLMRLGTSDILVLHSVFVADDYAAELPAPPATIVDAGAYAGYSSVYLAAKYPGATLLAIEPDPENFALLLRNTRGYPGIVPINRALWHRPGRLALRDPGTGHWSFSVVAGAGGGSGRVIEVEAVTIGELMRAHALARIDLLKVDIEGAEQELFEQSGEWIGAVGAIFAELHDGICDGCTRAFTRATATFRRVSRRGMTVCAIR